MGLIERTEVEEEDVLHEVREAEEQQRHRDVERDEWRNAHEDRAAQNPESSKLAGIKG